MEKNSRYTSNNLVQRSSKEIYAAKKILYEGDD